MPLNAYALETLVEVRLAEARAAAERDAMVRAARDDGARRPRWRARLTALAARWRGARPGVVAAPPAALSPSGVYSRSIPERSRE